MCAWVTQYVKSPPCRSKGITPFPWETRNPCVQENGPRLKILRSFIWMDTLTLKLLHVYIYSSVSRLGWRLSSHVKQGWVCVALCDTKLSRCRDKERISESLHGDYCLKMARKLSVKMTSRVFSEKASDLSFYSKCQSWGHF